MVCIVRLGQVGEDGPDAVVLPEAFFDVVGFLTEGPQVVIGQLEQLAGLDRVNPISICSMEWSGYYYLRLRFPSCVRQGRGGGFSSSWAAGRRGARFCQVG